MGERVASDRGRVPGDHGPVRAGSRRNLSAGGAGIDVGAVALYDQDGDALQANEPRCHQSSTALRLLCSSCAGTRPCERLRMRIFGRYGQPYGGKPMPRGTSLSRVRQAAEASLAGLRSACNTFFARARRGGDTVPRQLIRWRSAGRELVPFLSATPTTAADCVLSTLAKHHSAR